MFVYTKAVFSMISLFFGKNLPKSMAGRLKRYADLGLKAAKNILLPNS